MIRSTAGRIAGMIPGAEVAEHVANIPITGVSRDTRDLQPGCLYVPIIGERFDGHAFVSDAIRLGAAASLWQRDHGDPPAEVPVILVDHSLTALQQLAAAYRASLRLTVVAVTGSNGKTSTKDMIAAIAGEKFRTWKTQGNLNNEIGLPITLLEMDEDTEVAVLEMGTSGFGEIELLSRLAVPDIAVITNIGEAHMEQLGSREGIARAKFEIIAGLQPDGMLIYHGEEPLLTSLVEESGIRQRCRCVTFGMENSNDYYPADIRLKTSGTEFAAVRAAAGASRLDDLRVPLLGRHQAVNAMAAVAVGDALGLSGSCIRSGLASMIPSAMRTETAKAANGALLINDAYNASPGSMAAAVRLLGELDAPGRKVLVLGDILELGPQSETYHRMIGQSLGPDAAQLVFTYGKMAAYIAMECVNRYPSGAAEHFTDKKELIRRLQSMIEPDDTVLFKASRGMKLEEIVDALQ